MNAQIDRLETALKTIANLARIKSGDVTSDAIGMVAREALAQRRICPQCGSSDKYTGAIRVSFTGRYRWIRCDDAFHTGARDCPYCDGARNLGSGLCHSDYHPSGGRRV